MSGGAPPIEGVATGTAGFVGAAANGLLNQAVGPIANVADFTRHFGEETNVLAQSAAAFFTEGGKRLWVARVEGTDIRRGLEALEAIEEIAVIAAPGATGTDECRLLLGHAERSRRCLALLDPPRGLDVQGVLDWRGQFSSSRAALYYPWIEARGELLPPSGAVAGIMARSDERYGVHKAPANQEIRSATGLERELREAQQNLLNPRGINCLRAFEGRGLRVWGARTLAPDSEWRYVNVRRLFLYLEQSLGKGLQWVVFEQNGAPLWTKVREAATLFLMQTWRDGALAGSRAEESFYVRCDRTTMTQADLDAGRLICEVGVAPLKPAEFVVFRIEQRTGQA